MAILTKGDIAFTSFNADEDGWSIVTFVDIDPNTTIYFTDNEATSSTAFNTGESYFQWTSGANTISAGTIIRFSAVDSSTLLASSVGTLSRATVTSNTNYGLSATADIVYAFLGSLSSGVISVSNILTAVSSGDVATTGDAVSLAITNAGLTIGTNAILLRNSADYGEYSGLRTGQSSFAGYKSSVFNVANWTVDQTDGIYTTTVPSTTAFTIAAAIPTVNLSVSSASASEAGTTAITVTATTSSSVSSDQTVNLGVTGTDITAGDYNLSDSTITIPNGQTTGSVTFTVVDDVLVEGTETAILTISSPSSGITLGGTTSQNIAIADNDTPATPTVNLSVSSNASTEAGTTIITVTATVSSAVSSNQTVALGVSGTGITTSDYYLSNPTITIPSGQTTGSVNFIVADDAIAEGTETATLTISNPSAGLTLGGTTTQNITITNNNNSFLTKVGGATSANGAEISAFDSGSNRLFVVAGNTIEFYTVSTTGTLALAGSLTPTITPPVGAALIPNSVAVKNGVVAVAYAVQNSTTLAQLTGKVAFFNAGNGSFINAVDVGALPDMLTFTPDGTKVLVANEGEPNSYGQGNSVDPEGSVSIINIAGGVASATVQTADFTNFNSQIASLKAAGVRITGPGSTVAQDLEPEYIAVSPDGLTATITLQENNAIAILDIANATITQILPLGAKNYNLPGNGIDASDQDSTINGGINIQNWPVFGLYQPDAIASFSINGQAYYITANEGDSRAYTGFNEEIRVGAAGYVLDPTAFPDAVTLKENANLGRLQLTNATGDTDGDGDIDRIESFGARSFSIWNANGTQVFDSGDQLEQITAAKTPTLFNSDGTAATFNTRSDNKGPEPEGVVVGVINGLTYAFIGLERTGDVVVYDVTNPNQPTFVQYINTPEDTGTEGLTFISAADSPTGKPLLVTASEVSKTVAVFEVKVPTYIHDIQGSGTTAALTGTQTIEGIVTRGFQGSTKLNGFYVQEEDSDADNDATTSEAIFVYDLSGLFTGNVGDKVRVTGTAGEFTSGTTGSSLTQLSSITSVVNLGASTLPTVTNIQLPVTSVSDLERYEGMLVNISAGSGNLTVTENYQLGRFGQVVLAATGASNQPGTDARLDQYTQFNAPSVSGNAAYLAELAKRKIYLDDGSGTQNLDPILFGRGGNSLSATNTLRSGDTVNNITGILDQRFEGYRIQTTTPVNFTASNPRPDTPPDLGSSATLKVASFNVLNYFNDLDTNVNINTPNGLTFEPRGANTATEFTRQRNKTIQAIINSGADVLGLNEIENNGFGATSAIQDLVNGLNAVAGAGTYSFINPGTNISTDAITVGIIYKASKVSPVGSTATMTVGYSAAFDLVGRRPLAQTFQQIANGERFTAVVNHFKSKGSSSGGDGDADAGDGQGLSNGTRTRQAQDLATWLGTNPTGTTDPDYLLLGDFNAYAQENPLTTLASAGYGNLLPNTSYSYVFDGQVGALDHALGSASLAGQVTVADKWHINADEPSVLDYNTEFKSTGQISSLYSANQFRTSDHDPVIIGLNLNSNQAPTGTATATLAAGTEDTAYTINVTNLLTGFSDVDGDTLTVSGLTANNGTLVNNNDGTYTFNPTANFNGTVNLAYPVVDNQGGSVNATQSFAVTAVNDAPTGTATATLAAGTEDTAYTINVTNLLTGFSDVDGDTLTVSGLTANNGTLVNNNDGTYTFNPTANFNGTVTLNYSVSDGIATLLGQTLSFSVYNLINGTTNNNSLTATTNPDRILGNGGNDTIISTVANAGQNDIFDGGDGRDTLAISEGTVSTALTLNVANTSNQLSGISGLVVQNFESFNFTNFLGNLNATGSTGNDTITGGAGNDTLDGGAGTNTLKGGAGDDTYIISTLTNTITEVVNAGVDTVQSSVTYTLAANVENLVLTGTNDLNGTGNTLSNTLTGNSGNNTLNGGIGADTLMGGTGDDTYIVDNVGDVVVESLNEGIDTVNTSVTYTLSANVENLTLTGTGSINGTGNNLDNTITGNTGKNILDGGTGNDTLIGGVGNDTYIVDVIGDVITELTEEGTDTVNASISWALGTELENLTLLGAGNINATGNSLNNILTGNSGNNILTGGDGNDTLKGGDGNDTYIISTLTNTITEVADAGVDTVLSSVTYTLRTNVENLVFTGTENLNGTGNILNNTLTGNSGNNTLNGGTGADALMGGAGDDIYIVDNASDSVFESFNEGVDTVNTRVTYTLSDNVENLTLTGSSSINGTGNSLNNIIIGNAGKNTLYGGVGSDILTGGSGNDIFVIAAGEGTDTFTDFVVKNDKIGLSGGLTFGQLSFSGNDILVTSTNEVLATLTDFNTTTLISSNFLTV